MDEYSFVPYSAIVPDDTHGGADPSRTDRLPLLALSKTVVSASNSIAQMNEVLCKTFYKGIDLKRLSIFSYGLETSHAGI